MPERAPSEIKPAIPAVNRAGRAGFWLIGQSFELPLQLRILGLKFRHFLAVRRLELEKLFLVGRHRLAVSVLRVQGLFLHGKHALTKLRKLRSKRPLGEGVMKGLGVGEDRFEVGVEAHADEIPSTGQMGKEEMR